MLTPYLAGLNLAGRRVVVIGGGIVAQRRLPALLDAGAVITLISPQVTPAVEGMAGAAELTWRQRDYAPGDLSGAWYAMALTDSAPVNAAVLAEAESRKIFCVRADVARDGTAVTPAAPGGTPASGQWQGLRIAVMSGRLAAGEGGHDPLRVASVRDGVLDWLGSGAGEGLVGRPDQRPGPWSGPVD